MSQEQISSFHQLGLSANILEALEKKGFSKPSPIQEQVIPILLQKKQHVVAQAQTGTGKTAAFGIPIIENLSTDSHYLQAIILTPTRELCVQVTEELQSLCQKKKLNIISIYGGQSFSLQFSKLKKDPHIVVGTPGRVIDQINRKNLKLGQVSYFILDEADEMLSMGFLEDIQTIMSHIPTSSQTLLFSATFSRHIHKLVQTYIPEHVKVEVKSEELTTHLTEQIMYFIHPQDKLEALIRILEINNDFYGIIFCTTKTEVQNINNKLNEKGYKCVDLHGDLSQLQRENSLSKFKQQKVKILVATDVAARGIDVNNLTHVINFGLPQDPENYVHRIGRTGRAGKTGTAISLVSGNEEKQLYLIKKTINAEIKEQQLPSVEAIISLKKENTLHDLISFLNKNLDTSLSNVDDFYTQIKKQFEHIPESQINLLIIQYFLKNQLNTDNYKEIKPYYPGSRKGGQQQEKRIFIALGHKHGMDNKKIIELLKEKGNIISSNINKITILEEFSFVTLNKEDAYFLIQKEKKTSHRSKKPLISLAKTKEVGHHHHNNNRRPHRKYNHR